VGNSQYEIPINAVGGNQSHIAVGGYDIGGAPYPLTISNLSYGNVLLTGGVNRYGGVEAMPMNYDSLNNYMLQIGGYDIHNNQPYSLPIERNKARFTSQPFQSNFFVPIGGYNVLKNIAYSLPMDTLNTQGVPCVNVAGGDRDAGTSKAVLVVGGLENSTTAEALLLDASHRLVVVDHTAGVPHTIVTTGVAAANIQTQFNSDNNTIITGGGIYSLVSQAVVPEGTGTFITITSYIIKQ
jgi:hypothetical protein